MRRFHVVVVILAAAVVVLGSGERPGVARAQNFAPAQDFFRVESESARGKGNRLLVRGYVYNLSPYAVGSLRLGVEGLDAGGRATGLSSSGWVDGDLPRNDRRYFEVPMAGAAAAYRITVQSFEIRSFEAVR